MSLDQFYTDPNVAVHFYDRLKSIRDIDSYEVVFEPSAGTGSFYSLFPAQTRIGIDLEPKCDGVIVQDFLTYFPAPAKRITIGNPPFGKRAAMSIEFFNHASMFSDTIAFIVPLQWRKWSVQSKLAKDWKLILDEDCPKNSFISEGKKVDVGCCFQVWTSLETEVNMRLNQKPPTSHPDFEMFLYNNTPQAAKWFDEKWDIAIPRQGYEDYSRRETDKDACERNKQWIFIKAKSDEILQRLIDFDYAALSRKNTTIPGWGKADLVEEYSRLYK